MGIYYPKSKILENQSTNGDEFILKDSEQPYIGYYHAFSNNTYFTGKTTDDIKSKELIRIANKQTSENKTFSNLNSTIVTREFKVPVAYFPVVSEADYKKGFFARYFMRRRNSDFTSIVEISPKDYNENFSGVVSAMDTNLYVATKINWKITGPIHNNNSDKNFPKAGIIETNTRLVQLKEKLFPGISIFITDYSLYARPD